MENATKALIMAAGVLIGVLLLSLAVWLFHQGGGAAASVADQIKGQQISQFNRQFDKYISSTGVTIYDIVTVGGLARNYNIDSGFKREDENGYIKVVLHGFKENPDNTVSPASSANIDLAKFSRTQDQFQTLTSSILEQDRSTINSMLMSNRDTEINNKNVSSKKGYLPIYKIKPNVQGQVAEYNGPDR